MKSAFPAAVVLTIASFSAALPALGQPAQARPPDGWVVLALDEYRAAGLPPAYLPKNPPIHQEPGETP